ncbi:PLDc N-terminal domain-containing protein [Solitalea lacus]|uniref:PLDc N-terminal domain-containing protein n=1 Tax=Solitalea lacus TaxID=2911172 RepID=UPI001EDBABB7|nr:PLD nuclease N-terminal domain-containing protein [Solitalea lacus]UKJ07585.1 PLD nuclease N-terminal domain-containing protein [Solitalea lacus]
MNTLLAFLNLGTGEIVLLLFGLIVILPSLILWVVCLVDIVRSNMSGTNTLLSILLIVLFPLIGSIIYLIIRNKLKEPVQA